MYQVLYRKYRPKVFDDVVGQEHITSTLQNEINNSRHSHAYLFTGSRGTGKTTCARIFTKALNCLHPVDGNPCNECEICRGIDENSLTDIVEVDAASLTGVDNIRLIRDEANLAPVVCRYRVYIIDEVHMLSNSAFNALLKTLEEPPEHVKFILATTDPQKMPVTVLSRCQRFDFHRVSAESMKKRIDKIADSEGFSVDDEAALLIARLADGGMRDALSLLDRCVTLTDTVTAEIVSSVAGLAGRDHLFALGDAIAANDASAAISLISEMHAASLDMERLCSELIAHFRAIMIAKTVSDPDSLLAVSVQDMEEYHRRAKGMSLDMVLSCIDSFQAALANIKQGASRRTELELTLIKLCMPESGTSVDALSKRIARLEQMLQDGGAARTVGQTETRATANAPSAASQPVEQPTPKNAPEQVSTQSNGTEIPGWEKVVAHLQSTKPGIGFMLDGTRAYSLDETIHIQADDPEAIKIMLRQDRNNRDVLIAAHDITGQTNRKIAVEAFGGYAPPQPAAQEIKEKQSSNPALEAMLEQARQLGVEITTD